MPLRKPPCKGCEVRNPECHQKCERYLAYAELLKKDRAAKEEYRAVHNNWTAARARTAKAQEQYKLKKRQGVVS